MAFKRDGQYNYNFQKRYGMADKIDYVKFYFNYLRGLDRLLNTPDLLAASGVNVDDLKKERTYFYNNLMGFMKPLSSFYFSVCYIYKKEPHVFGEYRHNFYRKV